MAKFSGVIGFSASEETSPGVWIDEVVEKPYTGDLVRDTRRWAPSENVNPSFTISDTISIVADSFVLANMHTIKYIRWREAVWSITSITIERPRLILVIGGLYNGSTASDSSDEEGTTPVGTGDTPGE